MNATSGKCADLPGYGAPPLGAPVTQYTCNNTSADNQLWYAVPTRVVDGHQLYELQNAKGGLCLDLPGYGSEPAETPVSVYTCNSIPDNDNQEWDLRPVNAAGNRFLVVNYKDGLCLDVSGWASDGTDLANDTMLTVYGCYDNAWADNGYDDHIWELVG